jgi:hypothetical protein
MDVSANNFRQFPARRGKFCPIEQGIGIDAARRFGSTAHSAYIGHAINCHPGMALGRIIVSHGNTRKNLLFWFNL